MLRKRMTHAEALLLGSFLCVGIVLADDPLQLAVAFAAAIAMLAGYFLLNKRYESSNETYQFQKLLVGQIPRISLGLDHDLKNTSEDIQNAKYKEAYEKLRELGYFLRNDTIKNNKIVCLRRFIIRKDMELELETIIPGRFDKPFVLYLYEVSKVNKQLIRKSVLDYVQLHRESIEGLENGKEIMTNVVAAAIRMKYFVETYAQLVSDYVDFLPKERFLRLCKMLADSPSLGTEPLYRKCKETARVRYGFDPDFQGIW